MIEEHFQEAVISDLGALAEQGLWRQIRTLPQVGARLEISGQTFLNFSSNDYLGLNDHPEVRQAAAEAIGQYGTGACAARLVSGALPVHDELENELCSIKQDSDRALVFGAGYLANIGTIPCLVSRNDNVVLDRYCHASIVDGAVLSRARLTRFRHNDLSDIERCLSSIRNAGSGSGNILVVTESVFSMDGDLAPLREISALCEKFSAILMVDDAHALGVFGSEGQGLVERLSSLSGAEQRSRCEVDVCTATLSKAAASYGGLVVCRKELFDLFVNRARSFIYNTALPPSAAAAGLASLRLIRREAAAGRALGTRLLENARNVRNELRTLGFDTLESASQIIPLVVGSAEKATMFTTLLNEEGILAVAIRPPTVPEGTSRVRLSITLSHSEAELARLVNAARTAGKKLGVI